uniref:RING-type domain-containing protein n=1 Tax=Knipowitschia caucasica TaxID=637954 RepID=A0AAV2M1X5_KNICA
MVQSGVAVELLLLAGGLATALVSVILNYYMVSGWDLLPGGWDLLQGCWDLLQSLVFHEVSGLGWVWVRLGMLQLLLGLTFCHLVVVEAWASWVQLGMVLPVFLRFLGVPLLPQLVLLLLVLLLVLIMWNQIKFMVCQTKWCDDMFDSFTILLIMVCYWILRVWVKALIHLNGLQEEWSWSGLSDLPAELLVSGCESFLMELAMAAVFTDAARYVQEIFVDIVGLCLDYFSDLKCFWIVATLWGVSCTDPTQRLEILLQNLYLLMALGLTHLHQLVQPLLTAQRRPRQTFIPLFVLFVLTLFFPIPLVLVIWQHHDWSIWLSAATTSTIHLFLQVLLGLCGSVVVRSIQNTDQRDCEVSRALSLQHLMMMVFGALMAAINAYGFMFDSRRFSHLLLMSLHICSHIFLRMNDYRSEMEKYRRLKRSMVSRVTWHVTLTEEQLQLIDDVCSVCLLPFSPDCSLTPCLHYFHFECLRRWLSRHKTCPKCSSYVEKGKVQWNWWEGPWWEGPWWEGPWWEGPWWEGPGEQGEGPQVEPREQGEGPQVGPREQGEGPQVGPREQGEGPQVGPREQGEGPQVEAREQGEGPQVGPREQGEGPQVGPREQGEEPQVEAREQGEGPQVEAHF